MFNNNEKNSDPLELIKKFDLLGLKSLLGTKPELINMKTDKQETLLHVAAEAGSLEICQYLLSTGLQVQTQNKSGDTPLHNAAYCGHADIVNLLIKNGADINAKENQGVAPLHWAVSQGNQPAADALLRNGADVNITDNSNKTPLHYACIRDNESVVLSLVKHNANVNIQCEVNNWTPIFFAVRNKNLKIVKLLLEKGADINKKDAMGASILPLACLVNDRALTLFIITRNEYEIDLNDFGFAMGIANEKDFELAQLLVEYSNGSHTKPKLAEYCRKKDLKELEVLINENL